MIKFYTKANTIFILLFFIPLLQNAQSSSPFLNEREKILNLETRIEILEERNHWLNEKLQTSLQISREEKEIFQQRIRETEVDRANQINSLKEDFNSRLNIYVFFIGLILSIIAAAINFFGKMAIKERVEEIIQSTAENYAKIKTNEVLTSTITKEYTSKIIREKGEPEMQKLLKELEEKGKQTISDIRQKGDEVINSVWAAPPPLNGKRIIKKTDDIIQQKEDYRADEFFNLAFNTKDPKIKLELYKNVLEIEPDNYSALNNISAAYNEINNFEKAIKALDKAIELNPNYGLAFANRAHSYNQLENLDLALQDAEMAIKLNPELEWAYAIKGNILTKQKNYVEAERVLSKSIEMNPNSPEAYFNRGYFNEETKRYKESEEDYKKAEALGFSKKASLYNNLAVLYRRKKEFDKAIEYLEKAKNEDPEFPNIDGTMSLIYADKGEDEKFYKYLKIALDKGCPVWNYIGDYGFNKYRNTKKLKKLLEAYQKIHLS